MFGALLSWLWTTQLLVHLGDPQWTDETFNELFLDDDPFPFEVAQAAVKVLQGEEVVCVIDWNVIDALAFDNGNDLVQAYASGLQGGDGVDILAPRIWRSELRGRPHVLMRGIWCMRAHVARKLAAMEDVQTWNGASAALLQDGSVVPASPLRAGVHTDNCQLTGLELGVLSSQDPCSVRARVPRRPFLRTRSAYYEGTPCSEHAGCMSSTVNCSTTPGFELTRACVVAAPGYYLAPSADIPTACTSVVGGDDSTLTCTNATDSRVTCLPSGNVLRGPLNDTCEACVDNANCSVSLTTCATPEPPATQTPYLACSFARRGFYIGGAGDDVPIPCTDDANCQTPLAQCSQDPVSERFYACGAVEPGYYLGGTASDFPYPCVMPVGCADISFIACVGDTLECRLASAGYYMTGGLTYPCSQANCSVCPGDVCESCFNDLVLSVNGICGGTCPPGQYVSSANATGCTPYCEQIPAVTHRSGCNRSEENTVCVLTCAANYEESTGTARQVCSNGVWSGETDLLVCSDVCGLCPEPQVCDRVEKVCRCPAGYGPEEYGCPPICDDVDCVRSNNKQCAGPNNCTCLDGYQERVYGPPGQCEPVCSDCTPLIAGHVGNCDGTTSYCAAPESCLNCDQSRCGDGAVAYNLGEECDGGVWCTNECLCEEGWNFVPCAFDVVTCNISGLFDLSSAYCQSQNSTLIELELYSAINYFQAPEYNTGLLRARLARALTLASGDEVPESSIVIEFHNVNLASSVTVRIRILATSSQSISGHHKARQLTSYVLSGDPRIGMAMFNIEILSVKYEGKTYLSGACSVSLPSEQLPRLVTLVDESSLVGVGDVDTFTRYDDLPELNNYLPEVHSLTVVGEARLWRIPVWQTNRKVSLTLKAPQGPMSAFLRWDVAPAVSQSFRTNSFIFTDVPSDGAPVCKVELILDTFDPLDKGAVVADVGYDYKMSARVDEDALLDINVSQERRYLYILVLPGSGKHDASFPSGMALREPDAMEIVGSMNVTLVLSDPFSSTMDYALAAVALGTIMLILLLILALRPVRNWVRGELWRPIGEKKMRMQAMVEHVREDNQEAYFVIQQHSRLRSKDGMQARALLNGAIEHLLKFRREIILAGNEGEPTLPVHLSEAKDEEFFRELLRMGVISFPQYEICLLATPPEHRDAEGRLIDEHGQVMEEGANSNEEEDEALAAEKKALEDWPDPVETHRSRIPPSLLIVLNVLEQMAIIAEEKGEIPPIPCRDLIMPGSESDDDEFAPPTGHFDTPDDFTPKSAGDGYDGTYDDEDDSAYTSGGGGGGGYGYSDSLDYGAYSAADIFEQQEETTSVLLDDVAGPHERSALELTSSSLDSYGNHKSALDPARDPRTVTPAMFSKDLAGAWAGPDISRALHPVGRCQDAAFKDILAKMSGLRELYASTNEALRHIFLKLAREVGRSKILTDTHVRTMITVKGLSIAMITSANDAFAAARLHIRALLVEIPQTRARVDAVVAGLSVVVGYVNQTYRMLQLGMFGCVVGKPPKYLMTSVPDELGLEEAAEMFLNDPSIGHLLREELTSVSDNAADFLMEEIDRLELHPLEKFKEPKETTKSSSNKYMDNYASIRKQLKHVSQEVQRARGHFRMPARRFEQEIAHIMSFADTTVQLEATSAYIFIVTLQADLGSPARATRHPLQVHDVLVANHETMVKHLYKVPDYISGSEAAASVGRAVLCELFCNVTLRQAAACCAVVGPLRRRLTQTTAKRGMLVDPGRALKAGTRLRTLRHFIHGCYGLDVEVRETKQSLAAFYYVMTDGGEDQITVRYPSRYRVKMGYMQILGYSRRRLNCQRICADKQIRRINLHRQNISIKRSVARTHERVAVPSVYASSVLQAVKNDLTVRVGDDALEDPKVTRGPGDHVAEVLLALRKIDMPETTLEGIPKLESTHVVRRFGYPVPAPAVKLCSAFVIVIFVAVVVFLELFRSLLNISFMRGGVSPWVSSFEDDVPWSRTMNAFDDSLLGQIPYVSEALVYGAETLEDRYDFAALFYSSTFNCGGLVFALAPLTFFLVSFLMFLLVKKDVLVVIGVRLRNAGHQSGSLLWKLAVERFAELVSSVLLYCVQVVFSVAGALLVADLSSYKRTCDLGDFEFAKYYGRPFFWVCLAFSSLLNFIIFTGVPSSQPHKKYLYWLRPDHYAQDTLPMYVRPVYALWLLVDGLRRLFLGLFGVWTKGMLVSHNIHYRAAVNDTDPDDDDNQQQVVITLIGKLNSLAWLFVPVVGNFMTKFQEATNSSVVLVANAIDTTHAKHREQLRKASTQTLGPDEEHPSAGAKPWKHPGRDTSTDDEFQEESTSEEVLSSSEDIERDGNMDSAVADVLEDIEKIFNVLTDPARYPIEDNYDEEAADLHRPLWFRAIFWSIEMTKYAITVVLVLYPIPELFTVLGGLGAVIFIVQCVRFIAAFWHFLDENALGTRG